MTTPVDPGDTAALHDVWWAGYRSFIENCESVFTTDQAEEAGMQAVARAVCPPGYHVIADDDLRDVIEAIRHCRNVLAVGEWPDLDQATIDTVFRWKDIIGDE